MSFSQRKYDNRYDFNTSLKEISLIGLKNSNQSKEKDFSDSQTSDNKTSLKRVII